MQTSLTYLGTFDDVVERYPWNARIDGKYLRSMIVRHVLFGDRMLLNDGYLVMHPLMQSALQEGATNPLLGLIEDGYIAVLSSRDNIVESVEARAASGVASFKALQQSVFWADVRPRLLKMSERLQEKRAVLRWPRKDMGAGFRETILRARRDARGVERSRAALGLNRTPQRALGAVFDRFEEKARATTQALRTVWEGIVLDEADRTAWVDKRAMARELMGLANEAYHFNFASCLSAERPETLGVDTRHSDAFDELLDTPAITYERLRDFPTLNAPRHKAMFDAARLRDFVTPGYPSFERKQGYLDAQDRFLRGVIDPIQFRDVSNEYAAYIARYFGSKYDSKSHGVVVSLALFAGATAADYAGATPGVGAALGAVALFTEQVVTPHILRKVSVMQIESEVRGPRRARLSRSNALASVMVDKAKASALVANVPEL